MMLGEILDTLAGIRDARKDAHTYGLADATDTCADMWREGIGSPHYRNAYLNVIVKRNAQFNLTGISG